MKTLDELKNHFPNLEFSNKYLEIINCVREDDNCKISIQGNGGSGKSTLLKILHYMLSDGDCNVAVASSTGVASAILNNDSNVGATTIHKLFALKTIDIFGTFTEGRRYKKYDVISNVDVFIFDEVSMISADLFDYIMSIIKYCRHGKPTRIILFGDCLQLQCIVRTDNDKVKEYYENEYHNNFEFFSSNSFKDMNFSTFLLTKIYRQGEDDESIKFKDILNRIRVCEQTQDDLDFINKRVISEDDYVLNNESFLRIVSTNKDVMKYNKIVLDSIDGKYICLVAEITGNFRESSEFMSGYYQEKVFVKIGCPVMILKNSEQNLDGIYKYYNGSMGTLIACNEDEATVDLGNDNIVTVPRTVTKVYEYELSHDENGKAIVESRSTGSYENVMIKPCSALTIHKCQGLTINNGYIDFGRWIPDNGVYVALSRFRSIHDFGLRKAIQAKDIHATQESLNYVKNAEYVESAYEELFEKN